MLLTTRVTLLATRVTLLVGRVTLLAGRAEVQAVSNGLPRSANVHTRQFDRAIGLEILAPPCRRRPLTRLVSL